MLGTSDLYMHDFKNGDIEWEKYHIDQIVCLGLRVEHCYQPDLPQVGKLAYHLEKWSVITQDQ